MCKELSEIYESLSADHKNDLMVIAKSMAKIEGLNHAVDHLLSISRKEAGNP